MQRFRAVKLQVQSCNTRARETEMEISEEQHLVPAPCKLVSRAFLPPPPPLLLRSYTDRVFFQAGSSSSSPLAFCARTFNFAPRWQTATDKKRGPLCSLCLSQSASFLSRAILVLNCARANARTTSGFSDSGERLIRLSLSLPDVSSRGPMFFNP